MTANYDIVIRVSEQNLKLFGVAADQVTKVGDAVKDTDTKLKGAGSGADAFAQKLDAAGTRARIGLSSVSQLANVAGINISGIVGPAASAADAVGDLAGVMGGLGVSVPVVGAIAVTLGIVAVKARELEKAQSEAIKTSDAYLSSLKALGEQSPEIADQIDRVADATRRLKAAQNLPGRFDVKRDAAQVYEEERQKLVGLVEETDKSYDALERQRASLESGTSALGAWGAQAREAAAAAKQLASDTEAYYNNLLLVQGATNTNFYNLGVQSQELAKQNNYLDASQRRWSAYDKLIGQQYPVSVQQAKDATEDWFKVLADTTAQDRAKAAIERIRATLQGFIANAIQSTKVTQEDLDATKAGKYKPKWDELARQADAVATGTPVENFKDLGAALKETGMSAEQFAAAFRDMSLFVDPKNIKFADMDQIVASVKQQLDSMIGTANLTSAAMAEVWKNLSPQQKAALAKQGIDNVADAVEALDDPTSKAKKQVDGLNNAIGSIPKAVTTLFDAVTDKAKAAVDDLRQFLDEFINAYGTVTVSANGEFSSPTSGGETAAGSKGIPGRASGGYAGPGVYRLGEKGEEFVLDNRITGWIEKVLGHKITGPQEVMWLIQSLARGKEETLNQMALFASGRTNHAVPIPEDASKWLDDVYKSYALAHGFDSLPTDVQRSMAGGGGGGGGAGGGTGDSPQVVALLTSIDNKLGALLTAAGVSLQAPVSGKMPRLLNVDREVRMLALMGAG